MSFNYYQPTRIHFGYGAIQNLGEITKKYTDKVILVTEKPYPAIEKHIASIITLLNKEGIEVVHFDKVIPNPTKEIVDEGSALARKNCVGAAIGFGGGSSMDTAKAIAVGATHEGSAWDYLFYKKQPTKKTLPIISITTTSGTGSQVTPCAVMTNGDDKSAIWHENIFASDAIIDPQFMVTVPHGVTVSTGFDAFAHNFEAYISVDSNPIVEAFALSGIKLAIENLPRLVDDLSDKNARANMALADMFGGLAIASAGVTLPHGLGMQISGHCPKVSHGRSLAVTYPEFTRFTYESSIAKFARVGRMFNAELEKCDDKEAARRCCDEIDAFLRRIDMWFGFEDLGVSDEMIRKIADCGQVLNDYKNNPRIASIEEMYQILMASKKR